MKKQRILVAIICILLVLTESSFPGGLEKINGAVKPEGKVYTYFDMLAYQNNIIYRKDFEDGSGTICMFEVSSGKSSSIVTEPNGIIKMLVYKGMLYYTTVDSKARFVTYSISLAGGNKKRIVTGTVVSADDKYIVYEVENDTKLIVYTKDLKKGKEKKVFETKAYMDYIKNIGDTLYFYKYEPTPNRIKLYTFKSNESKMHLVTSDKCAKKEEAYIHIVSDVFKKDGNLYYGYGCFEGTGHYFYGTAKRIDAKGKKTTVTTNLMQESFLYDTANIYLIDQIGNQNVTYNFKTGKKTKFTMTVAEKQFLNVLGSKTYLIDCSNSKNIIVSRFQSGTDKVNLRKNFIKIPFKKNKKYSYIGETRKIGSHYVIGITTMDYNDPSYGWKGKEVAINWYVADKNGKLIGSFS